MTRSEVAVMQAHGQGSPGKSGGILPFDARLVVLVAVCGLLGGCEDIRTIFGDLSEEMRGEEAAEGRVGTLRALEVVHGAHRVADSVASAPARECALAFPDAGSVYTLEVVITREARDAAAIEWRETRTFTRDARGNMRLEMDASFRDDLGQTGSHRPIRMIVDGVGFEGPDAEHLYRRSATTKMRQQLRLEGPGAMQTLLDSVGGWAQEDESTWSLGREPLVCGPIDPDEQGWLRRLATRGDVVEAELRREVTGRELEIRWLLEDGVVMKIRADDRVEPFDGELEPPDPGVIIDVRRDREWRQVQDLLDRLEAERAIERAADEASSDQE